MMTAKLNDYFTQYRQKHGEGKIMRVFTEVETSKRFNVFISDCRFHGSLPPAKLFIECVLSSIKYAFAGNEKIALAALMLLDRWNREVNNEQDALYNEFRMTNQVEAILDEARKMS